jgi:hypothetical protein
MPGWFSPSVIVTLVYMKVIPHFTTLQKTQIWFPNIISLQNKCKLQMVDLKMYVLSQYSPKCKHFYFLECVTLECVILYIYIYIYITWVHNQYSKFSWLVMEKIIVLEYSDASDRIISSVTMKVLTKIVSINWILQDGNYFSLCISVITWVNNSRYFKIITNSNIGTLLFP